MNAPNSNRRRQVRWRSPIFDPSGYADEARYFLRELRKHAPVRLEPIGRHSRDFFDRMDALERDELKRLTETPPVRPHIAFTSAPAYALRRDPSAEYNIGRTMFETDRLPPDWSAACNQLDEIWVPTSFNVESFKKAGVTVPLYVIPGGVDRTRYHPELPPLEIPGRRRFAFLSVFEWIYRKGWDVLLRAWAESFSAEDDVCLIVRTYLPNATDDRDSAAKIEARIDSFLRNELGRARSQVAPIIILGDQIAQLDMPRLYTSADAFVLPTRGEGWGRPYIEAMACGLPVIGTRWGAQLAFMHDSNSILIDVDGLETVDHRMEFPFYRGHQWAAPSAGHLAKILRLVADHPQTAKKIGRAAATEVRERWGWERAAGEMLKRLDAIESRRPASARGRPISVSYEGSFLDFGSLSCVNRALTDALAKNEGLAVSRVSSAACSTAAKSLELQTYAKGILPARPTEAQITVRHQWPPDWRRPAQGALIVMQPWEFGALPEDWVQQASAVDEFWAYTNYVRDAYIASGVDGSKVKVVPLGIDPAAFHPAAVPLKLATSKSFKFLFVGGTIHRKGPDVLLAAYLNTFTAADDVCLVIKDFGGASVYAGQTLKAQIQSAQARPNAPEIIYLDEELPPDALPALYTACDCLAHPYRGEGFGLPVLEAMACGLPVVVTAGGSTDDFADEQHAYRIPAVKKSIGDTISGLKLVSQGWLLEPVVAALAERMKWLVDHRTEAAVLGRRASDYARHEWTWDRAAAVATERIQAVMERRSSHVSQKTAARPTSPASTPLPSVANLGQIGRAQELFRKKSPRAAWENACEAIRTRPHHPEAFLLLAEVARLVGDAASARRCAEHALRLAPSLRAAKKLLQAKLQGDSRPDWLVLPPPLADLSAEARPRLSVCLIVKNEEQFIGRCLSSIQPLADQIVVVDTGSTDRTVAIAQEYGAEIHRFAWCDDFSAARNAALQHATGDWVLSLDADEEVPAASQELLRQALRADSVLGWRLPMVDAGRENEGHFYVPRLFRNAPGIYFAGRVHEHPFGSVEKLRKEWGLENRLGTATLVHHGYTAEVTAERSKVARNLRLLELAVQESPGTPLLLMNLGLELSRSGRLDEGLTHYRAAFAAMSAERPESVVPELREMLLTQFATQLFAAKQPADVVRVLSSPLARQAELTTSLHYLFGMAHIALEEFEAAKSQMQRCLEKTGQTSLTPAIPEIRQGRPRHCLALCLARLQHPALAEKEFQQALRDMPDAPELHVDFAKFLADQENFSAALQLLHGFASRKPDIASVWLCGARIILSRRDLFEVAVDWTSVAVQHFPTLPEIVSVRAEALLLSGRLDESLACWRQLASEFQPTALAAQILCEMALGQSIKAVSANVKLVSQEFLRWYERLVEAGVETTAVRLLERADVLKPVLPEAAGILQTILQQISVPAAG